MKVNEMYCYKVFQEVTASHDSAEEIYRIDGIIEKVIETSSEFIGVLYKHERGEDVDELLVKATEDMITNVCRVVNLEGHFPDMALEHDIVTKRSAREFYLLIGKLVEAMLSDRLLKGIHITGNAMELFASIEWLIKDYRLEALLNNK